ncbi:hypothetical protein QYF61_026193 [Mycteria americana]|uniref:Uncharacterized protein n=1 Tax=Mycteria americana TaxID=33587 RepID=A0AAN7NQI5_MYCAM|nr:hypothetical protein QYF61_026193 [Mycteria americana]
MLSEYLSGNLTGRRLGLPKWIIDHKAMPVMLRTKKAPEAAGGTVQRALGGQPVPMGTWDCKLHQCTITAAQAASNLDITNLLTCVGDQQVQYHIPSAERFGRLKGKGLFQEEVAKLNQVRLCRQFYHHRLNQKQFQLSGSSQGLQRDLRCFSGIGGMARRAILLQGHGRHHGNAIRLMNKHQANNEQLPRRTQGVFSPKHRLGWELLRFPDEAKLLSSPGHEPPAALASRTASLRSIQAAKAVDHIEGNNLKFSAMQLKYSRAEKHSLSNAEFMDRGIGEFPPLPLKNHRVYDKKAQTGMLSEGFPSQKDCFCSATIFYYKETQVPTHDWRQQDKKEETTSSIPELTGCQLQGDATCDCLKSNIKGTHSHKRERSNKYLSNIRHQLLTMRIAGSDEMKLNRFYSLKFEMHKEGETNSSQPSAQDL